MTYPRARQAPPEPLATAAESDSAGVIWCWGRDDTSQILSLASQLALVYSVTPERRTVSGFATSVGPLLLVLVLMVFRPTWAGMG